MKHDPDKKDTSRGLGEPPSPAKLAAESTPVEDAEPTDTETRAKLFESDTITVSAETQRQWSMAERPRAKKDALVETLPPTQTEVKAPAPDGELATVQEGEEEAVDTHAERAGPTKPPKPHDAAKFEPERQAPTIDVSKATGSSRGDRAQTTWVTPRTQKRRFRRAALGATVATLFVLGGIWFVIATGAPSAPNPSSAKPEVNATTTETTPAESQHPHDEPLTMSDEWAARDHGAENSQPSSLAPTPSRVAGRSPTFAPAKPSPASRAPKKSATPARAPRQPEKAPPNPPKTPSPDGPNGKAEKAFDPTQPIYR